MVFTKSFPILNLFSTLQALICPNPKPVNPNIPDPQTQRLTVKPSTLQPFKALNLSTLLNPTALKALNLSTLLNPTAL